jgi:UDP-glucose 4-epimerase
LKEVKIKNSGLQIVIGGSGFIGGHLVKNLTQKGFKVISIDRRLTEFAQDLNVTTMQLDINLDFNSITENLVKLVSNSNSRIWHLAANSDISLGMTNPGVELNDTFLTSIKVSQIAKSINAKQIVFASSSAVYGDYFGAKLYEHKTELNPISYYGSLKAASELYLKSFGITNSIGVMIFRFPNVIGKKMTHGLLYDLPKKIDFTSGTVKVLGNGFQKKPYLFVEDLIDLMYSLLNVNEKLIDIFNLGPIDEGIEIREIVKIFLNKEFPRIIPIYENTNSGWIGDVPLVNLSVDKLKSIMPNHNLTSKSALLKTLDLT